MTRKDYRMIAKAISNSTLQLMKTHILKSELVYKLCDELKKDNNRFDRDRFINACYNKRNLSDLSPKEIAEQMLIDENDRLNEEY